MRRIGRWLRNGLTGLSLVLCVAMVALWVRSYFAWDMVTFNSVLLAPRPTAEPEGSISFYLHTGLCRSYQFTTGGREAMLIVNADRFSVPPARWQLESDAPSQVAFLDNHGVMGFWAFGWWPESGDLDAERWVLDKGGRLVVTTQPAASAVIVAGRRQRYLYVPLWFLTLLFAVLPVMGWRRRAVRLRREAVGRCRVCGYDLRASIERCPECGTAIG